jgi:RNA polymerase sigma factor (TIGR02999 family)
MARRELARMGVPQTLSPTSILHQVYIEVADREGLVFPDEARFLAYACRVMRGLIIDHARTRLAIKRGGQLRITSLNSSLNQDPEQPADPVELSQLSDALDKLGELEPPLAQIVDLKFFCGFTFPEIAALLKISERTAQRRWDKARTFLHGNLIKDGLKPCLP